MNSTCGSTRFFTKEEVRELRKERDEYRKRLQRANVLLYNALVGLEEHGCDLQDLQESLGITRKEYKEIMRCFEEDGK